MQAVADNFAIILTALLLSLALCGWGLSHYALASRSHDQNDREGNEGVDADDKNTDIKRSAESGARQSSAELSRTNNQSARSSSKRPMFLSRVMKNRGRISAELKSVAALHTQVRQKQRIQQVAAADRSTSISRARLDIDSVLNPEAQSTRQAQLPGNADSKAQSNRGKSNKQTASVGQSLRDTKQPATAIPGSVVSGTDSVVSGTSVAKGNAPDNSTPENNAHDNNAQHNNASFNNTPLANAALASASLTNASLTNAPGNSAADTNAPFIKGNQETEQGIEPSSDKEKTSGSANPQISGKQGVEKIHHAESSAKIATPTNKLAKHTNPVAANTLARDTPQVAAYQMPRGLADTKNPRLTEVKTTVDNDTNRADGINARSNTAADGSDAGQFAAEQPSRSLADSPTRSTSQAQHSDKSLDKTPLHANSFSGRSASGKSVETPANAANKAQDDRAAVTTAEGKTSTDSGVQSNGKTPASTVQALSQREATEHNKPQNQRRDSTVTTDTRITSGRNTANRNTITNTASRNTSTAESTRTDESINTAESTRTAESTKTATGTTGGYKTAAKLKQLPPTHEAQLQLKTGDRVNSQSPADKDNKTIGGAATKGAFPHQIISNEAGATGADAADKGSAIKANSIGATAKHEHNRQPDFDSGNKAIGGAATKGAFPHQVISNEAGATGADAADKGSTIKANSIGATAKHEHNRQPTFDNKNQNSKNPIDKISKGVNADNSAIQAPATFSGPDALESALALEAKDQLIKDLQARVTDLEAQGKQHRTDQNQQASSTDYEQRFAEATEELSLSRQKVGRLQSTLQSMQSKALQSQTLQSHTSHQSDTSTDTAKAKNPARSRAPLSSKVRVLDIESIS